MKIPYARDSRSQAERRRGVVIPPALVLERRNRYNGDHRCGRCLGGALFFGVRLVAITVRFLRGRPPISLLKMSTTQTAIYFHLPALHRTKSILLEDSTSVIGVGWWQITGASIPSLAV